MSNNDSDNGIVSFWELTDNPPTYAEKTAALAHWSTNYSTRTGTPFMVFLDLIGFSFEQFGESQVSEPHEVLGYLEISYLADALHEYANRPQDVTDFCEKLVNSER
jgi:hypothetical protein